jgi:hypothetical protein
MKLLKIRDQFINIDLLQSVNIEQDTVIISLSGERYCFAGEEAVLLKNWFNRYAFDLCKQFSTAIERVQEERPPVEIHQNALPKEGLFRKPFVLK